MSGGLGDNKFFRFANSVANVLIAVVGVLLFLGVFHLIDMRSAAVSVVLCTIMLMMIVAVGCAVVADIQVKRKKSIGDGLNVRNDAASIYDGEDSDESNLSVDT